MLRISKYFLVVGVLFSGPYIFAAEKPVIPKADYAPPFKPVIYTPFAPSVLVNPPPVIEKQYNSCCICQFYDGSHESIKKGASQLCDQWLKSSSCDYQLKAPASMSLSDYFKSKPNFFANQCKSTKAEYFGHGRTVPVSAGVVKVCFSITEKDLSVTEHGCSTFDDYKEVLAEAAVLRRSLKPGQALKWTGNQANAVMITGGKEALMKETTYATLAMQGKDKPPEMIFPECKMLGDRDSISGGRKCATNRDPSSIATAFCKAGPNQMMMLCCPFITKGKSMTIGKATFNLPGFKVFNWAFPVGGACPQESSIPPLIEPNF